MTDRGRLRRRDPGGNARLSHGLFALLGWVRLPAIRARLEGDGPAGPRSPD